MKLKILITGINGFVGSNLVKSFSDNYIIYGVDIFQPEINGVVKVFAWNQLEELPEVDVIIHLAGKAHDTKSQTAAVEYFNINTGLTKKIFDWYLKSNAQKFIFFSSVKAAADKVLQDKLREDVVPQPVGPYGESKLAAEKYILSHCADKSFYILRPSMIHGPGNKGNLNLLYQLIKKGIPYPLGTFDNKRSFTSIDNLIYLLGQMIEKPLERGIYNISDDETISTVQIIETMSDVLQKKSRIWNVPQNLILMMAQLGTVLHLPFNKDRLQKLTENYQVDNQKIKNKLGIPELPMSAQEGLRKTLNALK